MNKKLKEGRLIAHIPFNSTILTYSRIVGSDNSTGEEFLDIKPPKGKSYQYALDRKLISLEPKYRTVYNIHKNNSDNILIVLPDWMDFNITYQKLLMLKI